MPPIRKFLLSLFRNGTPAVSDINLPDNQPDNQPGRSQRDIIVEIATASAEGVDVNATEPDGYATNRFKVVFFGVVHAVVKFNFSSMAVDISKAEVNIADRNQGFCRAFIQNLYRAAQAGGFAKNRAHCVV